MTVFDIPINALSGDPADLARHRGKALLVVNVASRCGLTPQYAGLQKLADIYADRGLVVLGVPCNQFAGQEPGSAAEIADFCQVNYGVTFPLTEKVDVNGADRHPLYAALVDTPDADGHTGDVRWNFEKFLVAPDGTVAARFAPAVQPTADELRIAIEKTLPTS
ncbi:glutathione peroxidase [Micromonospora sp. WMMD961]|uniref:glutathione peroxidase n=1 Tax=Micromonospora sp. WMMD961 TaxID=3016100 RepID=UPI002416AE9C|nr:glutathione peroxidase [Micromonospora sp. WMMD961]MDG4782842.1 glutathione peroxidase [Micromonospora sp. WMMD961]